MEGKERGVEGSRSLRGGKTSLAKAREESERPSRRPRSEKGAPRARAQRLSRQGAPLSGWGGGRCKEGAREQLEGDWCSVTSPGGQPRGGEAGEGATGRERC